MPRPRGLPKTGGRQKGTVNRVPHPTVETISRVKRSVDAAVEAAIAVNLTPLQYMLAVVCDPKADIRRRDQMAVAAAPYCHPRLAVTDVRAVVQTSPDANGMSTEEYRLWARNQVRKAFDLPLLLEHEVKAETTDAPAEAEAKDE
jgi:hypothetical protein